MFSVQPGQRSRRRAVYTRRLGLEEAGSSHELWMSLGGDQAVRVRVGERAECSRLHDCVFICFLNSAGQSLVSAALRRVPAEDACLEATLFEWATRQRTGNHADHVAWEHLACALRCAGGNRPSGPPARPPALRSHTQASSSESVAWHLLACKVATSWCGRLIIRLRVHAAVLLHGEFYPCHSTYIYLVCIHVAIVWPNFLIFGHGHARQRRSL